MDDLLWGLRMTVLGMGLVFGLLALLWGLLTLVQRLDREPGAVPAPGPTPAARPGGSAAAGTVATLPHTPATADGLDAELVAAILAATLAHRALRRREAAPVMRSYLPGSQLHVSRWVGAGRARQIQSWQHRGRR
jgi:glutaconyl-CoA/methylmalonyl-CoA decarboxylase subunit delta